MYSHEIGHSLKEAAAQNPMALALGSAGLVGGIHYGARASLDATRPFAIFSVSETEREENSSGVALVTYLVELTVVVEQRTRVAGQILNTFRRYWGRLANLTTLDPDLARLVLVHPEPDTEIGEADDLDLGKDVILGITSLTVRLSEHEPEILED